MGFDSKFITLNATLRKLGLIPGPGRLGESRWTANVRWETTGGQGILVDTEKDVWVSGRVLALLPLDGGGVVVGAESGGVWIVDTAGGSIGVSHDWTRPDVLSLAQGPLGRRDVFAGCDGSMYRTDTRATLPILEWKEVGSNGRRVYSIAIAPGERKVVIATDDGVWWARMQFPPYKWERAVGLPIGAYSSVVRSDGDGIVAGAWGGGPGSNFGGIFVGEWQMVPGLSRPTRILRFEPAPIGGFWFPEYMGRISIAVCQADRSRGYAIVADTTIDETLAILRSDDFGRTWRPIRGHNVGGQAQRDQCIAVSSSDPDVFAYGGRIAGPVLSRDGGATWDIPLEGGRNTSLLHSDLNALAFDPDDDSNQRLFVGSDGGVVVTDDFGQSYSTALNHNLPTAQFLREPFATSSGSGVVRGLFGGGLQDNGNIYQAAMGAEWIQSEGGDGHAYLFLQDGRLLRFANGTEGVHLAEWNGTTLDDLGKTNPAGGYQGWFEPKMARVARPTYRDDRGLLIVIGGQGRDVFGMFDDGTPVPKWHHLASVPRLRLPTGGSRIASIEGVGSLSGETIYMGTNWAALYSVNVATGAVRQLTIGASIPDARDAHHVRSPIVIGDSLGFALLYRSGGAPAIPSIPVQAVGQVLRSRDLEHWDPLPTTPTEDGPVYTIAIDDDQSPRALFAATDSTVWASYDDGETWGFAGTGLPARAHSADLRLVESGANDRWLYLATYGRSAWRSRIAPAPALEAPTTAAVGASSQVAACGRKPDRVEVFWAAVDGSIATAGWSGSTGWQITPASGPGVALPGSPVSAIARTPSQVEVFWAGRDGSIRSTAHSDGRKWTANTAITPSGVAVPASNVSSINRPGHGPAAFWAGPEGAVTMTAWSPLVRDWAPPDDATGARAALPGSPIAAINGDADSMLAFWVQHDGSVALTSWDAGARTWTPVRAISGSGASLPGSPLAVSSRNPSHVDVFWIGVDGAVWTTWSDPAGPGSPWVSPFAVTDANVATPGTAIVSGAPAADHVDVAWVGADGNVGHTWWNTSTARWSPVVRAGPADASFAGSPLALAGRTPKHLDLFWVGLDQAIGTAWSERGPYGGPWAPPFPITPPATVELPDHVDVFLGTAGSGLRSTWWDRLVPTGWSSTFPVSAQPVSEGRRSIGALSTDPDHVEVVDVDTAGNLTITRWDGSPTGSGWAQPETIKTGLAPDAPVAVVSTGPGDVDVFYVDSNGAIGTRSSKGYGSTWSPEIAVAGDGTVRGDSPLSAIAVNPDRVEVFFVRGDGALHSSERDLVSAVGGWTPPTPITAPSAVRVGSDVAAVARSTNHVDVFYVRADGRLVVLSADIASPRTWITTRLLPTGRNPRADSPIIALSRSPDLAEAYVIDRFGTIRAATFDRTQGEWDSAYVRAANVPAGSALAGAIRSRHHLDLFWAGPAGELMTTWSDRYSPWAVPFAVAPGGSAGGAVSAIVRSGRFPAGFSWKRS